MRSLFFCLLLIFPFSTVYCDKHPEIFKFTDEPIDVVIPSVEKDLDTLELCIDGIRTNGNVRRIIVVSEKKLTDKAEWFNEAAYPFSKADVEKSLLSQHKPKKALTIKMSKGQVGWYYQQLLKLYAAYVIPEISSNVLVLDSDTIFLNQVNFLDAKTHAGLYNVGTEYHRPYFSHAGRLLPGFKKRYKSYSGIVHHMLFQKSVLDALFNDVEGTHKTPFWKAFCTCVNPSLANGASEYEIYFNYVFSKSSQPFLRQLKWANVALPSSADEYKEQGYHYISCHAYMR